MILSGRALKVGDHISTDQILPGRYMSLSLPAELAAHALEGLGPEVMDEFTEGDVLVAGVNFGTGSSREQAPMALLGAGFSLVIAASFGRIFYRNCINMGLPVLWSSDASRAIAQGDMLEVDTAQGRIRDQTAGLEFMAAPLPPFVSAVVSAGGLIAYARTRLGQPLVDLNIEDGT